MFIQLPLRQVYGSFHQWGMYPQCAGWFIMDNPSYNWMMTRATPMTQEPPIRQVHWNETLYAGMLWQNVVVLGPGAGYTPLYRKFKAESCHERSLYVELSTLWQQANWLELDTAQIPHNDLNGIKPNCFLFLDMSL